MQLLQVARSDVHHLEQVSVPFLCGLVGAEEVERRWEMSSRDAKQCRKGDRVQDLGFGERRHC